MQASDTPSQPREANSGTGIAAGRKDVGEPGMDLKREEDGWLIERWVALGDEIISVGERKGDVSPTDGRPSSG
jgi:hypothetical protein